MAKEQQELEQVKPFPPEQQAQWDSFTQKVLNKPQAPKLERVGETYKITLTDQGAPGTYLQLHNLTGALNPEAAQRLLHQVMQLCHNDSEMNDSLALMTEIQPQDAVEGMLSAQMLAAHSLAMNKSALTIKGKDLTPKQIEHATRTAMAAMRLFTAQMETLAKWRSKGTQKIVVQHQQVNVAPGAQAIVGDVNQGGGRG